MRYVKPPKPDPDDSPLLDHVKWQYATKRMSRSEFMRYATLLGMSVGAAGAFIAGCGGDADEAVGPPAAPPEAAPTPAETEPAAPAEGTPVRGGTYRIASSLIEVDHPARLSWVQTSNVLRQVNEYLTITDKENVTHPYLLEKWEVSDDAKTWTLILRQGIMFSNGQELDSDDVLFNFQQWFSEKIGSSVLGLLGPFLDLNGVEKVDKYTVRLNLKQPTIAIPEFLYHYPAQILHKSYTIPDIKAGESLVDHTIGTGPFILKELVFGERARVERNPNYWQQAPDGQPLPYFDEIVWTDLGTESAPQVTAVLEGQVDSMFGPGPDELQQFQDNPDLEVARTQTMQSAVMRMRTDKEPFTDKDVRNAFKLVVDRQEMANLAYFGAVDLGHDAHFAPANADYVEKPIPPQDIERAKQLLAGSQAWQQWGNKPITLTVKNDTFFEPVMAETFQRQAKQAGINIEIDVRPASEYWPKWNHYHFGYTQWTHRPLNTMLQLLAYTKEAVPPNEQSGNWNETRWVNDEFLRLLSQANATPDLEERLPLVSQMEDIQAEDGGIGLQMFFNVFAVNNKKVKGVPAHPTDYLQINEAWIGEA
jgi:peptide/nickel transport system substrate-binding protein